MCVSLSLCVCVCVRLCVVVWPQDSRDYVYSLTIQQLLSHINLELLFENLPNFSHLELTYGSVECSARGQG